MGCILTVVASCCKGVWNLLVKWCGCCRKAEQASVFYLFKWASYIIPGLNLNVQPVLMRFIPKFAVPNPIVSNMPNALSNLSVNYLLMCLSVPQIVMVQISNLGYCVFNPRCRTLRCRIGLGRVAGERARRRLPLSTVPRSICLRIRTLLWVYTNIISNPERPLGWAG